MTDHLRVRAGTNVGGHGLGLVLFVDLQPAPIRTTSSDLTRCCATPNQALELSIVAVADFRAFSPSSTASGVLTLWLRHVLRPQQMFFLTRLG